MESTGRLDTASISTELKDAISLPITTEIGFIFVARRMSSVCRSRSPAMLPEVMAGIIIRIMPNSMYPMIIYICTISEYSTLEP